MVQCPGRLQPKVGRDAGRGVLRTLEQVLGCVVGLSAAGTQRRLRSIGSVLLVRNRAKVVLSWRDIPLSARSLTSGAEVPKTLLGFLASMASVMAFRSRRGFP